MIDIRDFVWESCDLVVGQRRHILMYHKLISVQIFFILRYFIFLSK